MTHAQGISFNLIIIRVEQGKTVETLYGTSTVGPRDTFRIRGFASTTAGTLEGSGRDLEMGDGKDGDTVVGLRVLAVPVEENMIHSEG